MDKKRGYHFKSMWHTVTGQCRMTRATEARTANSTYKKLAVQWLNEALCPPKADFMVADSLVLRNRQLLVTAKRRCQSYRPVSATVSGSYDASYHVQTVPL